MKSTLPIVINWHITEDCNFNCQYCYAHWSKKSAREIIHNPIQTRHLIHSVYQFFGLGGQRSVRINIAGGQRSAKKLIKNNYIGFEESIVVSSDGDKKTIKPIQYIKQDQDNVWQVDVMIDDEGYKPLFLIKVINKNRILLSSLRNRRSLEMIRI